MNKLTDQEQGQSARISLTPCPKGYSHDQDKARSPEQTLKEVRSRLASLPFSVLSETRRIDNGRLGVPVYLSVCGEDARLRMPVRKQMGKGATPAQAEASALMELMERYGFFTFWERLPGARSASWSEAEALFGPSLMPIEEIVKACHDSVSPKDARRIMNLRSWLFFPVVRVIDGRVFHAPLDLFKQLGEFNGSSAGNTDVESILQGACELLERHVCCIADRQREPLPTIDLSPESLKDPVLISLADKFRKEGVRLVLKDFTMSMPAPTVAALAWDPATFPESSEIVFTAGAAATPAKAAIRAITEVAQLAGDFNSNACYEASGLPKFSSLEEAAWLMQGPVLSLQELPSLESDDILDELLGLAQGLEAMGFSLYSVSTANPDTAVPSHYSFAPGFCFRERDANASLGLFTGRLISEEADERHAQAAFELLENVCPGAHYIPFFKGMLALRQGETAAAESFFARAEPLQPDKESKALAAFYRAYASTLREDWPAALPHLDKAVALSPDMKEYLNFRGVCLFRLGRFEDAARDFADIIKRLDKGSVMDLQNLGLCHKRLGRSAEAKRYLQAALSIDPSLEKARQELEELV